jgi:septum formation protein
VTDKILGSASPRRAELFKHLFTDFRILSVSAELEPETGSVPTEFVVQNATFKAEAILQGVKSGTRACSSCCSSILFTFDTIVFMGTEIFGKPADRQDAFRMLKIFSGRPHSVATGYCVYLDGKPLIQDFERTEVFFHELTDELIVSYLDTGEFSDKAGAYGIQGTAGRLIRGIEGCFFNVVGLPVAKLFFQLREKGIYSQLGS